MKIVMKHSDNPEVHIPMDETLLADLFLNINGGGYETSQVAAAMCQKAEAMQALVVEGKYIISGFYLIDEDFKAVVH